MAGGEGLAIGALNDEERHGPVTGRRHGLKRLWFFSRGLVCDEPAVVPALDGAGEPMGSHDAITLRIRPG